MVVEGDGLKRARYAARRLNSLQRFSVNNGKFDDGVGVELVNVSRQLKKFSLQKGSYQQCRSTETNRLYKLGKDLFLPVYRGVLVVFTASACFSL